MSSVTLAATFPKVVVNTTTGVVEVYSGVRDAVARAGLAAEEAARIAADEALQAAIEAEEAARIAADQALADDIAAEAAAREALDDALAPVAKSGVAADVTFTPAGGISASDVQGAIEEAAAMGGGGGGDGDMLAAVYDPQDIGSDAFDRRNHHEAEWRFAVTPYDFTEGVGIGNSTNDTEAMLAFAAEITANDVGKAQIAGSFLLEEGVVFGPDGEGSIATKLIETSARLTAVAPIENLVTFRRFTSARQVGRLLARGTGGSVLDSNTCIHGIRLDRTSRSYFDTLEAEGFRGWGILNVGSNDHFIKIGQARGINCGASARDTRSFPVTVTDFDKTGFANIHQRSILTVDDPGNLPSAAHELRWAFILVNGFPHKIIEVDYDLGTLSVYPWLATADEVAGDFELVFGGGLRLGGQSAKSVVGSLATTRCGTDLWLHGVGTPEVLGFGSQFAGVTIALGGRNPDSAFGGAVIVGAYFEGATPANIVHVNQSATHTHGSTIKGITSLSSATLVSLRPRATGGVVTASRYFPVELTLNNRRWPVESADDVWATADVRTNYTLSNIPLPSPPQLRPSAATFTINLVDEVQYRRVKGSVPVAVILSGMGARKGTDGGYNGTVVINAEAGYTINDSGFQSVEITGPEKPARCTAWLEDDGPGPDIWRVTIEELDVVGGSESTPVFPGNISDLDVVTEGGNFLTVEFTEATNADYHEYRISLAGMGAWGGAEELPGSADDGTFTGDVTGLAENENYDVQVRGFNTNGPGEWSSTATGTTVAFPGTIDDLEVIATTDTSATLRFTEPLDPFDADSYEVRFSLEGEDDWSTPAALSGSSSAGMFTGVVDSGLTTDATYDFQVRGLNDNGEGEWSNTATALIADQSAWDLVLQAATWALAAGEGGLTTRDDGPDTFVEQWDDQSGNDRHLFEDATDNQPFLLTAEFNGKDVINHSVVERGLRLATAIDPLGAFTWYFVGRPETFAAGARGYLFGGTSAGRQIVFQPESILFIHNSADDITLTHPSTLSESAYYVLSFVRDGAGACSAFVNGVPCTNNPQTLDASMQFRNLGRRSASTGYAKGYVAHLIATTAHSTALREEIEQLLAEHWGITWGSV